MKMRAAVATETLIHVSQAARRGIVSQQRNNFFRKLKGDTYTRDFKRLCLTGDTAVLNKKRKITSSMIKGVFGQKVLHFFQQHIRRILVENMRLGFLACSRFLLGRLVGFASKKHFCSK
jgi:hypothetical protein